MKILVYGIGRERVIDALRKRDSGTTIEATSDYESALAVKQTSDVFAIGVCLSGAGGALAIPRALLGADLVAQLSTPTRVPSEREILEAVGRGSRVFGLAVAHVDAAVPVLLTELKRRQTATNA